LAILFLTNLGVRDLRLNDVPIERPRPDGERLLKEWPAIAEQLSVPILEASLRYLRGRGFTPDQIVLFVTDQPPTAPAHHRDRDTVYTGELAKRLLEMRHGLKGRVILRKTGEENPALYDEMHRFYARELARLARKSGLANLDHCYVAPVGGTPAANTGLLLNAVDHFGPKCTALYVREGTDTADALDVARLLHRNTLRQIVRQQLDNYQFAACLPLLPEIDLPAGSCCAGLAEYCLRRLNFDFAGALHVAEDAFQSASSKGRPLLDRAKFEARRLAEGEDTGALLAELADNMAVLWKNGAYLDYLARIVHFEEAAARFIVETYLPPLDYSQDDAAAREKRRRQIEERPDLLQYLESVRYNGQPLHYEQSNTVVLLSLVDYLLADRPDKPAKWALPEERRVALQEAAKLLHWLKRLNAARNRSIHHFGGASAHDIQRLYQEAAKEERDLQTDVQRLAELLTGRPAGHWFIDEARKCMLEELGHQD